MKRDSLHPRRSGGGRAAKGDACGKKDERLEERNIRRRLIAPVITTNSRRSLPSRRAAKGGEGRGRRKKVALR